MVMKVAIDILSLLYEAYIFSVFFRIIGRCERLKKLYRMVFYSLFVIAMGVLYIFVSND